MNRSMTLGLVLVCSLIGGFCVLPSVPHRSTYSSVEAQAPVPTPVVPVVPPAPINPPATIEVPPLVKANVKGWTVIIAKTKGKKVIWQPIDDITDKVKILPSSMLADSNQLVLEPTEDGWKIKAQYRFLAMTVSGDDPASAVCVYSVEPTTPPGPPPPPDTLTPTVKAAFAADPLPLPQRKAMTIMLAGVYEAGEDIAKDASIKSYGDLFSKLTSIRKQMGIADNIVLGVRQAIGVEQVNRFGKDITTALTDSNRLSLSSYCKTVSDTLMEVAK